MSLANMSLDKTNNDGHQLTTTIFRYHFTAYVLVNGNSGQTNELHFSVNPNSVSQSLKLVLHQ